MIFHVKLNPTEIHKSNQGSSKLEEEWRNLSFDEQLDEKDFTRISIWKFQAKSCVNEYLYLLRIKHFLKEGFFRIKFTQLIMSLTKGPLDIHFRNCAFRILWRK